MQSHKSTADEHHRYREASVVHSATFTVIVYFSLAAFRAKCPLLGEELFLFALMPMEATDETVDVTVEDTLAAARRTKSPVKFILSTLFTDTSTN